MWQFVNRVYTLGTDTASLAVHLRLLWRCVGRLVNHCDWRVLRDITTKRWLGLSTSEQPTCIVVLVVLLSSVTFFKACVSSLFVLFEISDDQNGISKRC
jgi:hypothetical protein